MTRFVSPDTIDDLLTTATADLRAINAKQGHCGCVYDGGHVGEYCWPHRVLGLLVPTVEAFEPVF